MPWNRPDPPGSSGGPLRRLQLDVSWSWQELRGAPGGASPVFEAALSRLSHLLPCSIGTKPVSAVALNLDLKTALANHHPEEIVVLAYSFHSSLVDVVDERLGHDWADKLEWKADHQLA